MLDKTAMNELDEQLNQLIIAICDSLQGSLEWQKKLTQIITIMQNSGKIRRYFKGIDVSEDDYRDALQETWKWFCYHLNEHVPARGSIFLWFNKYLYYRCLDCTIEARKNAKERENPFLNEKGEWVNPVDTIPSYSSPDFAELMTWLNQERMLCKTCVSQRSDINCQVLIEQRLLFGTSWRDLAQQFGVSISTLNTFFDRKCLCLLNNFLDNQI